VLELKLKNQFKKRFTFDAEKGKEREQALESYRSAAKW
jgi:hypothetical protein